MKRTAFKAVGLLCAGLFVGCATSKRQDVSDQGVSITKLNGWKRTTQRGTAVFSDPKSRATIAIRSVPFEGKETGPRHADQVIAATKTVLERLPGAHIKESYAAKSEQFDARTFELTYTPPGKRSKYERRHTVLIGEARIYHIWLTAPAGKLAARAKTFDKVVDSLREEG